MKKVLFTLAAVGLISFTSCKKTEEKVDQAVEQGVDQVETGAQKLEESVAATVGEVVLPEFSNPEVTSFVKEYNDFYKKVKEAGEKGDATKAAELTAEGQKFALKLQEISQKITTEDAEKLKEWTAKLAEIHSHN